MPLKHNTWTKFYPERQSEDGTFQQMFESKMIIFNVTTLDHPSNVNALKLTTITSSTFNCLLLPPDPENLYIWYTTSCCWHLKAWDRTPSWSALRGINQHHHSESSPN
jgi:hypothetical protein